MLPPVTGPDTSRLDVTTRLEEMFNITVPAVITPPVKLPIDTVFAVILERPVTVRLPIETGDAVIKRLPLEMIVVELPEPPPPEYEPVPALTPFMRRALAPTTDALSSEMRDIY